MADYSRIHSKVNYKYIFYHRCFVIQAVHGKPHRSACRGEIFNLTQQSDQHLGGSGRF